MAHKKKDWENIYKDYVKSGLERGEYIKKYQLSTYAFEKFKKLDAAKNTKDVKTKKDAIFVPVQLKTEKEEPTMVSEKGFLELSSGTIKIIVTEQTNQTLLVKVLKAIHELC